MSNENNYTNISKLDAAKRQLESAITMFFHFSDVVAIHTLTAAAHQILMDLGKKQGVKSLLKNTEYIKEEKINEFKKIISEAENFFKHADMDPKKVIKFNPKQTEALLYDTCEMYKNLSNENPPLVALYVLWFYTDKPQFLLDQKAKEAAQNTGLDPNKREDYLKLLPNIISMTQKLDN
ncbi:MAG: hypothetical protein ABIH56_03800 [Candidatus Margulisiibacteriota bacterium]